VVAVLDVRLRTEVWVHAWTVYTEFGPALAGEQLAGSGAHPQQDCQEWHCQSSPLYLDGPLTETTGGGTTAPLGAEGQARVCPLCLRQSSCA
jgi:hypothetical protein